MAQNQSEIRYLNPPTVEVKKKKYCRFKKAGAAPPPDRYLAEVPEEGGYRRQACSSFGHAAFRNRHVQII